MFQVALTNLGKYNEGELAYDWLTLPATEDEIANSLEKIGIDNVMYEEYFISDYNYDCGEIDIENVMNPLGEYTNLKLLNVLAERLEFLCHTDELELFNYALEINEPTSPFEVLKTSFELQNYWLLDASNEKELGEILVEEGSFVYVPDELEPYINHESIGRDYSIRNNGTFVNGNYIEMVDNFELDSDISIEDLEKYNDLEIKNYNQMNKDLGHDGMIFKM